MSKLVSAKNLRKKIKKSADLSSVKKEYYLWEKLKIDEMTRHF